MQGASSSAEESARLQARVEELQLQLERSKRQHTEIAPAASDMGPTSQVDTKRDRNFFKSMARSIRMSAAQGTAAESPSPAKKQRSLQSLPVEEGETFGVSMSAAQGTAAEGPPPAKKQRSFQSLPVEEGETFGVSSGFSRVPSSSMITRTQSAEMNAVFYHLTLTRPGEAQLIA